MSQWIKNIIANLRESKREKNRIWEIWFEKGIWLTVPRRLFNDGNWEAWASIQIRILDCVRQYWGKSHTYIRFSPYPQGYYQERLQGCSSTMIIQSDEKGESFLFKDCVEESVLETIFSAIGMVPYTRCVIITDQQPDHWNDLINRYFEIAQQFSDGKNANDFSTELNDCHLLCYSMDQDLVIQKIDLEKSTFLFVLEQIASEFDLNIIMRK